MSEIELLNLIHTDLGNICSLGIFFVLVVLCYFTYKFFDMFFKIQQRKEYIAMLDTVITDVMLSGVLDEIIGLLPVVIPTMISFIALRKGIAFVQHVLHSAQFIFDEAV